MSWYNLEKTVRRISEGAMKSSLSILRRIAITAVVLVTMIIATGISYAADEVRPDNGIPVVYITIDESQGTIAAMNEDEEHNTRCQGTISIDVTVDLIDGAWWQSDDTWKVIYWAEPIRLDVPAEFADRPRLCAI